MIFSLTSIRPTRHAWNSSILKYFSDVTVTRTPAPIVGAFQRTSWSLDHLVSKASNSMAKRWKWGKFNEKTSPTRAVTTRQDKTLDEIVLTSLNAENNSRIRQARWPTQAEPANFFTSLFGEGWPGISIDDVAVVVDKVAAESVRVGRSSVWCSVGSRLNYAGEAWAARTGVLVPSDDT